MRVQEKSKGGRGGEAEGHIPWILIAYGTMLSAFHTYVGWLVDWLVGWLIGWLVGCIII
jgi:hypothetical protein